MDQDSAPDGVSTFLELTHGSFVMMGGVGGGGSMDSPAASMDGVGPMIPPGAGIDRGFADPSDAGSADRLDVGDRSSADETMDPGWPRGPSRMKSAAG